MGLAVPFGCVGEWNVSGHHVAAKLAHPATPRSAQLVSSKADSRQGFFSTGWCGNSKGLPVTVTHGAEQSTSFQLSLAIYVLMPISCALKTKLFPVVKYVQKLHSQTHCKNSFSLAIREELLVTTYTCINGSLEEGTIEDSHSALYLFLSTVKMVPLECGYEGYWLENVCGFIKTTKVSILSNLAWVKA